MMDKTAGSLARSKAGALNRASVLVFYAAMRFVGRKTLFLKNTLGGAVKFLIFKNLDPESLSL